RLRRLLSRPAVSPPRPADPVRRFRRVAAAVAPGRGPGAEAPPLAAAAGRRAGGPEPRHRPATPRQPGKRTLRLRFAGARRAPVGGAPPDGTRRRGDALHDPPRRIPGAALP